MYSMIKHEISYTQKPSIPRVLTVRDLGKPFAFRVGLPLLQPISQNCKLDREPPAYLASLAPYKTQDQFWLLFLILEFVVHAVLIFVALNQLSAFSRISRTRLVGGWANLSVPK